jgi:P2 family phage contractile tail tube protein
MIPKILKSFNLFIDGRGYVGLVEDITLPKLSAKMTELHTGGMDMPLDMELGMDKLECSFSLCEYDIDAISQFGLNNGAQVPLTLRGALDNEEGVTPIVITLQGAWKELDFGNWKAGDKPSLKVNVTARYYKLEVGGEEMVEIDVPNMVRKIKGVDQLEATRAAIGI